MSGPELCREIRTGSDVPIIVLTARNTERDKVMALDAGADDYVVRPVGIQEVLARVRAALRRAIPLKGQLQFKFGELAVDFERRQFCAHGVRVHLTPKELGVLHLLVTNPGEPVSHRRMLQIVWGPDYGDERECLRVVISELRKKIERDPGAPKYICTEHSCGYRFEPFRRGDATTWRKLSVGSGRIAKRRVPNQTSLPHPRRVSAGQR
jgi:two-component system KDP operon response regulator KdpE